MVKGKITKVVGKISDEIVEKYRLYEYRNEEIIQSLDLYVHTQKHANEFKSIDNYNNALLIFRLLFVNPILYTMIKKEILCFTSKKLMNIRVLLLN